MGKVTVVVGGQYGSEGKGAITGHLAKQLYSWDTVIRVAGPNAGHTAYDERGREWKLRAVPVAAVTNLSCKLHIAAGSEVDLEVLAEEIRSLEQVGISVRNRLTIHPSATILSRGHREAEYQAGLVGRIGSTGKGIGAARASRIYREATTFGQHVQLSSADTRPWHELLGPPGPFKLDRGADVIIEGTQGYGLGLHTENYPQVTSSDCRAIDFLAMAGISPWALELDELQVIVVARVYPIRVAGNSGPLKGETTWEALGLKQERTTVTNKVRRVGEWDQALALEAIRANGGGGFNPQVVLALTMIDQLFPDCRDKSELTGEASVYVEALQAELGADILYVGSGPNSVVEL